MPSEFKKPPTPPPPPVTINQADRLLTQIAYQEKREEVKLHQRTDQYSTPQTIKPPILNNKLSPIDKVGPVTRINTQLLVPIKENSSFDEQSQIKRHKIDDNTLEFNLKEEDTKEDVCLSTIDDIEDDDLKF